MKTVTIDNVTITLTDEQVDKLLADSKPKVVPFKAKGSWYVGAEGTLLLGFGSNIGLKAHFNYYETEELAKLASKAQRKHNILMNYVLQKQGNLDGDYHVYHGSAGWSAWTYDLLNLGTILMTKKTADSLADDLNSGVVVW